MRIIRMRFLFFLFSGVFVIGGVVLESDFVEQVCEDSVAKKLSVIIQVSSKLTHKRDPFRGWCVIKIGITVSWSGQQVVAFLGC